ncbi:hypothetical protein ABW19_dt0203916 [Dactylella cylindrospora]|nr:hypothetical protein ABW19_dt0203916 [Dactylella cylindrospora]
MSNAEHVSRPSLESEDDPSHDQVALLSSADRANNTNNDSDNSTSNEYDAVNPGDRVHGRQFTIRGILVGCFVGTILAAVNVYFGLQSKSDNYRQTTKIPPLLRL